ncbi:MAG: hypothetical protein AAF533_09870 [Acidobacteriota bacterium]
MRLVRTIPALVTVLLLARCLPAQAGSEREHLIRLSTETGLSVAQVRAGLAVFAEESQVVILHGDQRALVGFGSYATDRGSGIDRACVASDETIEVTDAMLSLFTPGLNDIITWPEICWTDDGISLLHVHRNRADLGEPQVFDIEVTDPGGEIIGGGALLRAGGGGVLITESIIDRAEWVVPTDALLGEVDDTDAGSTLDLFLELVAELTGTEVTAETEIAFWESLAIDPRFVAARDDDVRGTHASREELAAAVGARARIGSSQALTLIETHLALAGTGDWASDDALSGAVLFGRPHVPAPASGGVKVVPITKGTR